MNPVTVLTKWRRRHKQRSLVHDHEVVSLEKKELVSLEKKELVWPHETNHEVQSALDEEIALNFREYLTSGHYPHDLPKEKRRKLISERGLMILKLLIGRQVVFTRAKSQEA